MDWLIDFVNNYVVAFGLRILMALIVLVIGLKLSSWIVKTVKKGKAYQKLDINAQEFIGNVSSAVLKVLVIIVVVQIMGVPSATIITVLGSCGLAIGLALQGGLSNIASGVVIMVCKPFHVGDFIITGSVSGVVKDLGIYYTTITTPDNQDVFVPNSTLSGSTISNLSTEPTRRIDFDFNVAYDTDIDLARKVLLATAQNNDLILKDPEAEVFVAAHGESAITIKLRVWCKGSDYWTVYFDTYEDVKKAFDQFKITIPYNQLVVHMNDQNKND